MAVPGPSDRTYSIDDQAGTPADVSPLLVGEPSNVGALEEILHDLTGPADAYMVQLPVGFTKGDDQTYTFKADVGGSSPLDPTTAFYVTRGVSRTITITFVTNWTFASESYIKTSKPKTGVQMLSLLEVVFTLTGTITVA